MEPDFGLAAGDYVRHRLSFPPSLLARLEALGVGLPGQRVVDIGTGTGALARALAARGSAVVGVDPSAAMIEQALGVTPAALDVRYVEASAEDTGLVPSSADAMTALQCWHWLDRPRALAEARRLLVDGGPLAILHFDWLARPGNVVERTLQLLRERAGEALHADRLPRDGLYLDWLPEVEAVGFGAVELFSYDVDVAYSKEAWRGRVRASSNVTPSLSPDEVSRFDTDLAALLDELSAGEGELRVPHRVFGVIARKDARAPQVHPGRRRITSGPVVAREQTPWKPSGREGSGCFRRALAKQSGGKELGASEYLVPPGAAPFPLHWHAGNEEALLVLEGQGDLTLGEQELEVRAGDWVSLPRGPAHAHQLKATGATALRYLVVSTMNEPDVMGYPRSKKVGVMTGAPPGGDAAARTLSAFFREEDATTYWEGED